MQIHPPIKFRLVSKAVLLLSAFLVALQTIDYINFTVDDVFIPMRIAENAAHGDGLVYNVGEYVEGHSDPLWVAMLTVSSLIGAEGDASEYTLLWVAKALSYIFGLLCLWLTHHLLKQMLALSPAKEMYASLGVLALAICAPFILWSCSGLEMTLVAFFYLLATYAAHDILSSHLPKQHSFYLVAASFTLASLTRPEAPLFAAIGFAYLFFASRYQRKIVMYGVLPYVLVFGSFLCWRFLTYGDLLPSAFYAKTSNGLTSYILGTKYFLGSLGGICGPLIVTVPFALSRHESLGKIRAFMIALLGATMIFTVYSSGDWMPAFRFLILVAPIIAILGILSIRIIVLKIASERAVTCNALYLIASISLVAMTNVFVMRDLIRGNIAALATGFSVIRGHVEADHERVAKWLQPRLKENDLVATGEAGLIGYLNPHMKLLDLNGLMDEKIARDRKAGRAFDAAYVLDKAPKFIILYGKDVFDRQARALPQWGDYSNAIMLHPRFNQEYERTAEFISFDIYQKRVP